MAIEFRLASFPEEHQQILQMDAVCFPLDAPPSIAGAEWFIGWDGSKPAAYCAWKTVEHDGVAVGFHYRAGVLGAYRGRALQRQMLRLREARMRAQGLKVAVTYTDADAAASMRNLIAEGFRPYAPTPTTTLSGLGRLGRVGFVHWRKLL
jgi:ribosomal protein S18 acetylase RimI-like enzyme